MANSYGGKAMSIQSVCILGLGYIGLPTAAVFASRKIKVIGVDINAEVVDAVNRGQVHFVEPDLDMLVSAAVNQGYLRAGGLPEPADAFLISVPTPFKDGHQPDLSYIESASRAIAAVLKKGDLVILESTSPVGATQRMAQWMAEVRPDLSFPQTHGEASDIRVAHCPERVLPGQILHELVQNDRVVGGMTPLCAAAAANLYRLFVRGECFLTNARTAEMCKLTENSFRDVNIAFANELSLICDKLGIDVWELIKLANRHPRVNILNPGPGVGGHCIAVDPWFIVDAAPELAKVIGAARQVNDAKPAFVIAKVLAAVGPRKDAQVACFGLAFKADIDDLRESPALQIAEELARQGVALQVVEPFVSELPPSLRAFAHVQMASATDALRQCDIVLGLVDHSSFRRIDRGLLSGRIVIDTRGIWR